MITIVIRKDIRIVKMVMVNVIARMVTWIRGGIIIKKGENFGLFPK